MSHMQIHDLSRPHVLKDLVSAGEPTWKCVTGTLTSSKDPHTMPKHSAQSKSIVGKRALTQAVNSQIRGKSQPLRKIFLLTDEVKHVKTE